MLFLLLLYVVLAGIFTYARMEVYHPDFMNYVDVANHIRDGKGLIQSSFGFNENHFPVGTLMNSHYISQAPLYPLLIGALSVLGLDALVSATLLITFSHALLFLLVYQLANTLYEEKVGIVSVILLLFYLPLRIVVHYTLSEPLAAVFLVASFLCLIQSIRQGGWFFSGVLAGLSFATRYAMAPALIVSVFFLFFELTGWRKKITGCIFYISGFALLLIPIITHHFWAIGKIFSAPHPTHENIFPLLWAVFRSLVGEYSAIFSNIFSATYWGIALILATLYLIFKSRNEIFELVFKNKRFLLLLWPFAYLFLLVIERSHLYFDEIDARLIFPAGLTLLISWSGLFVNAFQPTNKVLWIFAIASLLLASVTAVFTFMHTTHSDPLKSPTMKWISENTTSADLILINDAVDIPFVFKYPSAVSYSYVPDSDPIEEHEIQQIVDAHKNNYKKFFLIFRTTYAKNKYFGPLIDALLKNPHSKEPTIQFIQKVDDGVIFEVFPS